LPQAIYEIVASFNNFVPLLAEPTFFLLFFLLIKILGYQLSSFFISLGILILGCRSTTFKGRIWRDRRAYRGYSDNQFECMFSLVCESI